MANLTAEKLNEYMVRNYQDLKEQRAELQREYEKQLADVAKKFAYYAEQAKEDRFYPDVIRDCTGWLTQTVEKMKKVDAGLDTLRWVERYVEDQEAEK